MLDIKKPYIFIIEEINRQLLIEQQFPAKGKPTHAYIDTLLFRDLLVDFKQNEHKYWIPHRYEIYEDMIKQTEISLSTNYGNITIVPVDENHPFILIGRTRVYTDHLIDKILLENK